MRIYSTILAATVTCICSAALAQMTTPSSTPASQSNPPPAGTPAPTTATTPDPTSASDRTPTPSARPANAQNRQQPNSEVQFPATQRNTNPPSAQQNVALTRCAALTGIPKAECERRDSPNVELPAGRTHGQMERQAQREAAANRAPASSTQTQTNPPRE